MNALIFVFMALWAVIAVAARRLFKGPLYPGWTYRYEAVTEVLRDAIRRSIGRPIGGMRKGMVGSRIHPKILRTIEHGRTTFAGHRSETFTPTGWADSDPTILYLHGGGYTVCSPATHRDLIARIAAASGARAIAIDYRKAPEHPFPAPIDDAEAAYREILTAGTSPSNVFIAGDSAGGGLTLALLQRVRGAGLPMPRGAILLSPWVDLECTGESIQTNKNFDYLPADGLAWGASQYLQGADCREPTASAVHADFAGFPPLLIQTGGAELFLSENKLLAERALAAGIDVDHQIEPGMVHVFQAFASLLPECQPAISRIGAFVRTRHAATDRANAVPMNVDGAAA